MGTSERKKYQMLLCVLSLSQLFPLPLDRTKPSHRLGWGLSHGAHAQSEYGPEFHPPHQNKTKAPHKISLNFSEKKDENCNTKDLSPQRICDLHCDIILQIFLLTLNKLFLREWGFLSIMEKKKVVSVNLRAPKVHQ